MPEDGKFSQHAPAVVGGFESSAGLK